MRFAYIALLLGGPAIGAAQGQEPLLFPSEAELVTVDAVVLDRDGQPVPGLGPEDFAIFEDGERQPIVGFEALDLEGEGSESGPGAGAGAVAPRRGAGSPGARTFFVLVDDLGIAPDRVALLQSSLRRLFAEGLIADDEVTLATASGDVWWSARIPEGLPDLEALVPRLRGRRLSETAPDWVGDWEAYRIDDYEDPAVKKRVFDRFVGRGACLVVQGQGANLCEGMVRGRAREINQLRRNRTRSTAAAIENAIFALTAVRGRKSLLFFSEGFLDDAFLRDVREVRGACLHANIAVYFLDVRGLATSGLYSASEPGPAPPAGELVQMQAELVRFSSEGSVALAEDTGGFAAASNDLAGAALRAAGESRVHYLIGFVPPGGKSPTEWRKLEVKVGRPGLEVRARKGYTLRGLPPPEAPPVAEGGEKPASVAAERSLANAHQADGIGLRARARPLAPAPEDRTRVGVAVEIDTSSLAFRSVEGGKTALLELVVAATHRDTGVSSRYVETLEVRRPPGGGGWAPLTREFDLPAGAAQARVVVRDEASGQLGAVSARFDVPAPDAVEPPPAHPSPGGGDTASLDEPGPESYTALLQMYRQGESQAAVTALAGWPHHDSQEALLDDEVDGTAAVLLHTEVGLAFLADLAARVDASQLWRIRKPFRQRVAYHLDVAEELLERRSGRWSGGPELHRAWLLAVGAHMQAFWQFDDALRYFERALEVSRKDPEVLLALGALHEMASLFRVRFAEGLELTRRQAEEWMARQAEKHYRDALEADPGLAEARLRLGRLLARHDRNDEAERELHWVTQRREARHLRSLAHLFLGEVWEKTGRTHEALPRYQEAIRQAPESRAAYVALTHALLELGLDAAAREAAVLATRAGRAGARDPWLDYHFRSWATGPALAALRQRLVP